MRRISFLLIFLLAAAGALCAADKSDKPAAMVQLPPKPLLPQSFAGWTAVSAPVEATHSLGAVSSNSTLMQELAFKREAMANYQNGAAKIHIDALQFADATSAYAYFPDNANGAVETGHANFRNGDTVVLVDFDSAPAPHLHADLQALKKMLPIPFGSKGEPPSLPEYLPKNGLTTESVHYALGPVGFASTQSPLAGKLDFSTDAEAVVANYGSGSLTLVEYPTPQMAAAQLTSIAAMLQLTPQKGLPDGLLGGNDEVAWRTGPLVALTSGMPQVQAVKLAHELHYESSITWNHPEGYVSDAWRAAHLYLGIFALAGILCAAAVILGLFFGGGRALIRVLRGKPASAVDDVEFLRLNIERPVRETKTGSE